MTRAMALLMLVVCAAQVGFGAEPGAAAETPTPLAFADYLCNQGDYYRAITEYERYAFMNPGNALALQAKFQIGMCYFRGQKWEPAIRCFLDLKDAYPKEEVGKKAVLMLAETHYRMQNYGRAVDLLEDFVKQNAGDPYAAEAKVKLGLCYLQFGNTNRAVDAFNSVPRSSPLSAQAGELARDAGAYNEIPRKNPLLAGGLSAVLPGAGQLYIQRPGDALIAFAMNGLMIGGAVAAFHNDEPVAGSFLLLLEMPWYFGNIYNATTGAHKFNRRQKETFFEGLEVKYGLFKDSSGRGDLAPAVGVGGRF